MNIKIIILALCIQPHKFIKVLTTPKFAKGKAPSASFATLQNPSSPVLTKVSSCLWTSLYFEDFAATWSSDNRYFGTLFQPDVKYFYVGHLSIRLIFPEHFPFTPEKWMFFCFSFDNTIKMLKVYVDSEKIIEKIINKGLENFELNNDFLKHERFARAKEFAGQISDLNVWSKILNEQEVKELNSFAPDIVNWNKAEFDLGPNITISPMP